MSGYFIEIDGEMHPVSTAVFRAYHDALIAKDAVFAGIEMLDSSGSEAQRDVLEVRYRNWRKSHGPS